MKQHARQSLIHTQLGSMKIDTMMYMMYKYIRTFKRFLEGAHVCMRSKCFFIIVDFAFCFSLESSRIDCCALCDGFPVHRGPLGRRLVRIASMECCPVRSSGSGPHRKEAHYLSPRHVSAHCTLSYPSLPYPDLPYSVLLSSSICMSVFLSCESLI